MSGWSGRVGWVGGWLLRLGGLACPTCPRMLSLPIPPPLHPPPRPSPMQPPPSGQALLLVAEAQLTLLLRLAMAGPPLHRAASAQRLLSLHALPRLAQCRALGLQPEEPGFAQYTGVRGAGGGVAGCAWGVGSGVGWGVRGRGSAASSASRHHPHARTSPTPAPPSPHSPPPPPALTLTCRPVLPPRAPAPRRPPPPAPGAGCRHSPPHQRHCQGAGSCFCGHPCARAGTSHA